VANRKKGVSGGKGLATHKRPVSLAIAERGISTGNDFAAFMSAMMGDLISGRLSPGVGNAACNAGGKLLKVVELQMKYGTQSATNGPKVLFLAGQPTFLPESDKVQ
jgi:hypothetical protein